MWKVQVNCLLLQVATKLLNFRHTGGTEASDDTAVKPFNLRWCCQEPAFVLEPVVTCPPNKAVQILICSVQLPATLQAAQNKPQGSTRIPVGLRIQPGLEERLQQHQIRVTQILPNGQKTRKTEAVFLQCGDIFLHASHSPPPLPSCNRMGWAGFLPYFFVLSCCIPVAGKAGFLFSARHTLVFLPWGEPSWRDHTSHCQSQRQGTNFHRLSWMFWFQPCGLCITGRSEVIPEGNRGVALPFWMSPGWNAQPPSKAKG